MDNRSHSVQYTFDVNTSPLFVKDNENYINIAGVKQLNSLENLSLLDIFMSKNNVVEPHYHQNAAELVYVISGSVLVAILNPHTKQLLQFQVTPGQIANIPQGWWHYEIALQDHTHLLAIFNASTPEVVLGSDILAFTPANVMAHTYCLDQNQWQQAIAPIKPSTYIGPYTNCSRYHQYVPQTHYTQQYWQY
ncbi:cupin domain-containing protein [Fictibacillus iocasae]|uniref:Cupin domain-containing protein n=1 Tax=Fictibacillus iocasae TaxID=2715437 RepID=A0ABW2NPQ2_9BACL